MLEPLQRRSGTVPLTVSRHVEDLAEVAPVPATLVGWSWGAMLGLSYATRYPERVTALVLVGCGTYDADARRHFTRTLEEQMGDDGRRRIDALRRSLAEATSPSEKDAILGKIGAAYMKAEAYDLNDESLEHLLPVDARGNAETWADALRLQ